MYVCTTRMDGPVRDRCPLRSEGCVGNHKSERRKLCFFQPSPPPLFALLCLCLPGEGWGQLLPEGGETAPEPPIPPEQARVTWDRSPSSERGSAMESRGQTSLFPSSSTSAGRSCPHARREPAGAVGGVGAGGCVCARQLGYVGYRISQAYKYSEGREKKTWL